MIPSFESNEDINTALFIMASLSPKVKDSVELELYRQDADSDQSDEQYVLEDAFVNLIRDLEEIGVIFEIDYSTYCQEMGTLFSFLRLVTLLLPNSLYDVIKTNTKMRSLIDHINQGNLGDDQTTIQIYLSEIAGLDGNPPIYPELVDYIDEVYPMISQTSVFSDYFRNIDQLLSEERMMIESDHKRHIAYTSEIQERIGRLSDAVNLYSNDPRYDEICRIQNQIISDLTSPSNFHDYCYLFLESPETLPEDLIESYNRKWYYYRVSNPWCFEYYELRKQDVGPDSPIRPIIFCVAYALSDTIRKYQEMVRPFCGRFINIDEAKVASLYHKG